MYKVEHYVIRNVLNNKCYSKAPLSEEQKLKAYCGETRHRVLRQVDKVVSEIDGKEHWIWKGGSGNEYGQSTWKSKPVAAHIVSYLAFNEIDLEEKNWDGILHSCREKKCVNPEHLRAGSSKENGEDMIRDGTSNRGERHHNSKISEDVARQIKLSKGTGTSKQRAQRFKTSLRIVTAIDCGSSWGWLFNKTKTP